MHDWNIAHCDIKPQNILLDKYYNIKVSDFGHSEILEEDKSTITVRKGTRSYMAPELLPLQSIDPYNPKCSDIYSLGMTLLSIISGELVFHTYPGMKNSIDNIHNLKVSQSWKDILSWMLSHNPKDRPTAQELESHPWVSEGINFISPHQCYQEMETLRKNGSVQKDFEMEEDESKATKCSSSASSNLSKEYEELSDLLIG